MKKNLVLTISVGKIYQEISLLTHPSLKAYADKIGADFMNIDKSDRSSPHWEKFRIFNLLSQYDRIIYFDTDIIIREDCPNLFDIVPRSQLGIFNEMPFTKGRGHSLNASCKEYDIKLDKWDGKYYNTGVMVISREHRYLFKKPEKETFNFYEQGYLNAIIARESDKFRESKLIFNLHYKFNRMTCMDLVTGEERFASYIIHYAGYPSLEFVLALIKKDLQTWSNGNREYKRHILIDVQGGLGDQINAEPAIRFLRKYIYPKDDVNVKTHFPELFKHLDIPIYLHEKWRFKRDTPYFRTLTLPGPETLMWSKVSNLLCHTVDYCSMAILKRTLPILDRQPYIEVNPKDIEIVKETIGVENLDELILLHSGRHWESKTFPKEWWQKILDGMLEKNMKVCLIGKDEKTRGVWNLDAKGAIDTRNLLDLGGLIALISKAGVLISNDSAPIHIAGAFDNYIILIPSCKHPDHILPYRKGNIYHKAFALYKKLMISEYESAPTTIHEVRGDKIPNGTFYDYLPEVEEVIAAIERII